jgi:type II secretory pathway component HofQ
VSCLSLFPWSHRPRRRGAADPSGEARISIDFKDADILDIVRLLVEVGDFQVVADPGVACKLTLKLAKSRCKPRST